MRQAPSPSGAATGLTLATHPPSETHPKVMFIRLGMLILDLDAAQCDTTYEMGSDALRRRKPASLTHRQSYGSHENARSVGLSHVREGARNGANHERGTEDNRIREV